MRHVWEGEPIWGLLSGIYFSIWIGLELMRLVVRDYRLVHYGTPASPIPGLPQITEEQAPAFRAADVKARAAMETWDQQAAIKAYREALPGFKHRDAFLLVVKLQQKLRAEQPEKFAYPPFSLANISWRGMFVCALIEAAVLGGLWWYNRPVSEPGSTVLLFTYGFLFGLATVAFTRMKDLRQQTLLLAPFLLAVVVGQALLQSPGWPWQIVASLLLAAGVLALTRVKGHSKRVLPLILVLFVALICEATSRPDAARTVFGFYLTGYAFGALLMGCGLAGEAGRALRKKLTGTSERGHEGRNV